MLKDWRTKSGYRYGLFDLCEEYCGYRLIDGDFGILSLGKDVLVKVIFEQKSNATNFQTGLHRFCVKKKQTTIGSLVMEGELCSEGQFNSCDLIRIWTSDYLHVEVEEDNSPPYSIASTDTSAYSATHQQCPKTNPQITLVMIEDANSAMFLNQIAEKCHLKKKESNENNYLYMSRFIHQHFDGLDSPMLKPSFLLHYVSHEPELQLTPIQNIWAHKTTVHAFFYDQPLFNTLVPYLKTGSVVTVNDIPAFELALFFKDANKAKEYLDWKENDTRKLWS
jgi:hypothetical protein